MEFGSSNRLNTLNLVVSDASQKEKEVFVERIMHKKFLKNHHEHKKITSLTLRLPVSSPSEESSESDSSIPRKYQKIKFCMKKRRISRLLSSA